MKHIKVNHKFAALAGSMLAIAGIAPLAHAGEMPSADQIRAFFATNPDNNQIQAMANQLGLNVDQTARAMAIGRGYDPDTMNRGIYQGMVGEAKNMTVTQQGGMVYGGTERAVYVTKDELAEFFATNPSDDLIAAKAAELGLTMRDIQTALSKGRGQQVSMDEIRDAVNNSAGFAWTKGERIVRGSGKKVDAGNGQYYWESDSYFNEVASTYQPQAFSDVAGTALSGNAPIQDPNYLAEVAKQVNRAGQVLESTKPSWANVTVAK